MAQRDDEANPVSSHDTERCLAEVTCTGCACLCDDLILGISSSNLIDTSKLHCTQGQFFFSREADRLRRAWAAPEALIAGQVASFEDAFTKVVERLARAGAPLILGPSASSIEAQRQAVALADQLSAEINTGLSTAGSSRWLARQRAGWVSATWGEIIHRADLVVFWDVDPGSEGPVPRFMERFLDRPGRFVPGGRSGRHVVHVSCYSEPLPSGCVDEALRIVPGNALAGLEILRALIRGSRVDSRAAERSTGQTLEFWLEFTRRLASARYGVLVTGSTLARQGSLAELEALECLVAELNLHGDGRFVGCALGEAGNRAGLEAVLGWQAGAPGVVNFSRGYPRYLPFEAQSEFRLQSGQADLVLMLGPQEGQPVATEASTRPGWIQIGYDATLREPETAVPDLALAVAHPWLEAGGTVMRSDGVTLPLTPLFRPERPDDTHVLARIRHALMERGKSIHE